MILLIRENRIQACERFRGFKFHYDSINSFTRKDTIFFSIPFKFHYDSINSRQVNSKKPLKYDLNSIMILLILSDLERESSQAAKFKFHYDSINSL